MSSGVLLLALTGFLLFGPLRDQMNSVTACLILLHIWLGFLLLIPVGIALVRMVRQARMEGDSAHRYLSVLALMALLCAVSGLLLWLKAAFGSSVGKEAALWNAHIAAGFAALAAAAWRYFRAAKVSAPPAAGAIPLSLFVPWLMLGGAGALWGTAAALPEYRAEEVYRDLTATNAEQAQNPHFPAGVRFAGQQGRMAAEDTVSGGASSEYCGREGCHSAAFQQWSGSAHHLAGIDPVYRVTADAYAEKSGRLAAQWCEGCHSPLAVSGNAEQVLNTSVKADVRVAEGVNCVTCHAAAGTPTRTGNGRFLLVEPQNYPFASETGGWPRRLHEFLLRVRPAPHQRAFLKPELHASAEFCSSCHRQSFNVPQNHYQFVRGPDEYGEWQSGSYSGRVVRPPGLTVPVEQTCQDCHFPRQANGTVSHETLGANTALPAWRGDLARLAKTEEFLRRKRVTLDLFALRRPASLPGQSETWIAPLDSPSPSDALKPGETVTLDVVVANRSVGHNFPAGYEDIKSVWLEVCLLDGRGRILLANGLSGDPESRLPPDTHVYTMTALNREGEPLTKHNLTEQVTTLLRRSIAPGSADIARYKLTLPDKDAEGRSLAGSVHLRARLFYRPIRPEFAKGIAESAAKTDRDAITDKAASPVTMLAEAETELPISRKDAVAQRDAGTGPPNTGIQAQSKIENQTSKTALSSRFINYGLGLLAPPERPDLARALSAFQQARDLTPDRPEPLLGLGRVYLAEAEYLLAREQFEAALRIAPGNRMALADLGVILTRQGQYDRALERLRPLAAQFPQDSRLQLDFGLALFGSGSKYEEATQAFERALAVDPENAAAHLRLKRCYQKLRRIPEMQREEAIGRYLEEDSLGQRLKETYLSVHPEDRQAAQPIPEHTLRPVKK